jgi:hypothetical protein
MKIYLLLFAFLPFYVFSQNRIFVKQDATGLNDGTSWANAYTNLHTALQNNQPGDSIWVAEGRYVTTTTNDRSKAFEAPAHVRLFGGFAGNETDIHQRDWKAHPTVLSGDIGIQDTSFDNSYNVVIMTEVMPGATIDGFTIRDGNANYQPVEEFSHYKCGGGLYINAQEGVLNVKIRNCRFAYNNALNYGGGVFLRVNPSGDLSPTLINCSFTYNTGGDGGGLYFSGPLGAETSLLYGCRFELNKAVRWGGGFCYIRATFFSGKKMVIRQCDFKNNMSRDITIDFRDSLVIDSTRFGGRDVTLPETMPQGFLGFGAGYLILRDITAGQDSSIITNASFSYYADRLISCQRLKGKKMFGMYIATTDPKVYIEDVEMDSVYLSRELISHNANYDIINPPYPNPEIIYSRIKLNKILKWPITSSFSYERFLFYSTYTNELILENLTFSECDSVSFQIARIHGAEKSLTFKNSAFVNCKFWRKENYNDSIRLNLQNCVFVGNSYLSPPDSNIKNTLTHCYTDHPDCSYFPWQTTCGPGNIFGGDPGFADAANGDYRLLPCSPLVDAGDSTGVVSDTDLDGKSRIEGPGIDIGPYETGAFGLDGPPRVQGICNGTNMGAITLTPANACGEVSYQWSPVTGTGPVLSGLAAGTYQVTMTDERGYTAVQSIVVPTGMPLTLQVDADAITCFGDQNGMVGAMPITGQPPFEYLWNTGQTASVLSQLGPGQYNITVTDAYGCTAFYSFELDMPTLMVPFGVSTPQTNAAMPNGTATAVPSGGNAPFDFLWSNGQTTQNIQSLTGGFYTCTVTDLRGCTATLVVEVKSTVSSTVGPDTGYAMQVWPNPTDETLWVSLPEEAGALSLRLTDVAGRVLLETKVATGGGVTTVGVGHLPPGVYLLSVLDSGRSIATRRVAVCHPER